MYLFTANCLFTATGAALTARPITCILVAQRPETIAGAQRVVGVDAGKAVELRAAVAIVAA
ncbi:MAG: hypothetical protein CFE44_01410 [Burkholderiales bacterium PBB4]|nr:MAG: hypothetical protein CFE44_01410 [Burkholderiales bacterium PBB4]